MRFVIIYVDHFAVVVNAKGHLASSLRPAPVCGWPRWGFAAVQPAEATRRLKSQRLAPREELEVA